MHCLSFKRFYTINANNYDFNVTGLLSIEHLHFMLSFLQYESIDLKQFYCVNIKKILVMDKFTFVSLMHSVTSVLQIITCYINYMMLL